MGGQREPGWRRGTGPRWPASLLTVLDDDEEHDVLVWLVVLFQPSCIWLFDDFLTQLIYEPLSFDLV